MQIKGTLLKRGWDPTRARPEGQGLHGPAEHPTPNSAAWNCWTSQPALMCQYQNKTSATKRIAAVLLVVRWLGCSQSDVLLRAAQK